MRFQVRLPRGRCFRAFIHRQALINAGAQRCGAQAGPCAGGRASWARGRGRRRRSSAEERSGAEAGRCSGAPRPAQAPSAPPRAALAGRAGTRSPFGRDSTPPGSVQSLASHSGASRGIPGPLRSARGQRWGWPGAEPLRAPRRHRRAGTGSAGWVQGAGMLSLSLSLSLPCGHGSPLPAGRAPPASLRGSGPGCAAAWWLGLGVTELPGGAGLFYPNWLSALRSPRRAAAAPRPDIVTSKLVIIKE